jgi:RHS repeat-associated protein
VSSSTDTQGNATAYTYNGVGNRASAKDALAAEAKLDYNDDGTVKTATDPGNDGNPTRHTYDADKQLTTVTPPTGNSLGVRRYTYDGYGQIKSAEDGAGRVTTVTYDADGRTVTTGYSDSTKDVAYTYNPIGDLTQRVDATGTTTFTYDTLGRLASRTAASGGGTLTYTHDPVGNLKKLTDGRGSTTYTYNSRNLLTSMKLASGLKYTFQYDKDGRRTHTYFNHNTYNNTWAAHTVSAYDSSGRLTRVTTTHDNDPNDLVYDTSFCYAKRVPGRECSQEKADDTGIRQWQTDHRNGGAVTEFTYDKGNRLTRATNVDGKSYDYGYDVDGNRTSAKVDGVEQRSLTFNSGNQVTNPGNSFDGAGNQTRTNDQWTLKYNAAEQMTSASDCGSGKARAHQHGRTAQGPPGGGSGCTLKYAYAGTDQNEALNTGWEKLVYGRVDQFGMPGLQSFETHGETWYVDRDSGGAPLGFTVDGEHDNHYVLDGLGSVVAIIGEDGEEVANYKYDPYGRITSETGDMAHANIIRYTGGIFDDRDDHTKLGRRWYDPVNGRFTQQDSLNFMGDPTNGNRYAYAGANPVNNIDPTGMVVESSSLSFCFVFCIAPGYAKDGNGEAGFNFTVGVGTPGIDLEWSVTPGELQRGDYSASGSCTAGPAGVAFGEDSAGNDSYGYAGSTGAGCGLGLQWQF